MENIVRFSVSIEEELLEQFDAYCKENHFATRSEAIRQIFREKLTAEAWESDDHETAATLTIVYDHHRTNLADSLLHLQHEHTNLVVATTHVHLDHDNCLEVIILRGKAGELREIAAKLKGLKGIRQGQLVLANAKATP
jgi:CopG family transcriptional regulator, nickel-responsive regulator